jgi:hypothetical protein
MISEPIVCLAQTMHLSCTDTNTITKRIEMRFHMTQVTEVFYQVCPKWFSSLWYVWRKPCTYLALTLTISPNVPKWDSTWPTSPRRSIGCVQQWFLSVWYVRRKPCTYLASRLVLSPNGRNKHPHVPRHLGVPFGASKTISKPMVCVGTNRAPILHWY